MTDSLSALWTAQHRDAVAPDPAALAAAEIRLRRQLRRRDRIEYLAGALAIGAFAHTGLQAPHWGVRLACLAVIAGALVTMANLWRRRPAMPAFEQPALAFYRAQLVAQRDALASVWRWYLAPVVPGLSLFLLAIMLTIPIPLPRWGIALAMPLAALPVVAVFWGIHRINQSAARRLQRSIDALDRGEIA